MLDGAGIRDSNVVGWEVECWMVWALEIAMLLAGWDLGKYLIGNHP